MISPVRKTKWKKVFIAAFALVGAQLCAFSWARAQVSDHITTRGLEFGRQLMHAGTLLQELQVGTNGRVSDVHQISLNGAEVRLHTGSIERTRETNLSELTARVKAHCRDVGAEQTGGESILEAPVVEWVGEDEAFVYCIRPRERWSADVLEKLFNAFEQSLDLSEWGDFQGAFFRATPESIAVVTIEVTGGLVPSEMFPARKESPGDNFSQLPAPPGRRLLAVGHQGSVALTVHSGESDARTALSEYQRRLVEHGISVKRASDPKGSFALAARSGQEAFVVVAQQVPTGSQLTIARLPH